MHSVGINAQLLSAQDGYRRAGIHHYIWQLLQHLPADDRLRYLVFTGYDAAWSREDLERVAPAWPTENRWLRILWEQLAWPAASYRRPIDLLHSMAFVTPLWSSQATMVTVYDLSFVHFPDRFPLLQRFYLQSQTKRSCRRARRIVTISESGRDDVHRFYHVPLERIDVVSPGVDDRFRPYDPVEIEAFRRHQNLPEQYVLHVGTLQPRKNIPTLLEALARIERSDLPLVLVGGRGWLFDEIFARIEALGLEDRVRFAGYVSDEALPLWYNAASLLAFPSVYEGFGMPVLQAMACGTPVVAADTSSIPEAAGDAALTFSPHDAQGLVRQMLAVLDNREQAATMRERGLRHAQNYSWERAGNDMAAAYLRALAAE
jgi:glycosyltransferase involved in cell wall biosynthesis